MENNKQFSICINANKCLSTEDCPHRNKHEYDPKFCADGKCSQGEFHCIDVTGLADGGTVGRLGISIKGRFRPTPKPILNADKNANLKIRAWDGKVMHYNVGILGGLRCPVASIEADFEKMTGKVQLIDSDFDVFPPMFSTGLTDKAGKEAYGNDLVLINELIYQVYQGDDGQWRLALEGNKQPVNTLSIFYLRLGKITGNIYETPGLINQCQKEGPR